MTLYKNDEIQNGVDKEKLPPLWLYLANISPSLCYIYNTFTPSTTYCWGHHPLCRVHHTKQNCDQRLQKIKTIFIIPRIFHLFFLMLTDFQGESSLALLHAENSGSTNQDEVWDRHEQFQLWLPGQHRYQRTFCRLLQWDLLLREWAQLHPLLKWWNCSSLA